MRLHFDRVMDESDAVQLNSLQLAYLGDTVWELIVRYELILRHLNVKNMHKLCVSLVNAKAQAKILVSISNTLTKTEKEIVQRGRNTHAKHPIPHNQAAEDYAMATGFEALLGFLFLTGNEERINQLIQEIKEVKEDG